MVKNNVKLTRGQKTDLKINFSIRRQIYDVEDDLG